MPELPEVETVRRGLAALLEGDTIARAEVRRADLRRPFPQRFASRLENRRIASISRRAKYLLFDLGPGHDPGRERGEVLVVHLGMSGSFRVERGDLEHGLATTTRGASKLAAHDHVVWQMRSGALVTYNDPRRFGLMDLVAADALEEASYFAGLGIEPLGNRFDADHLAGLMAGRSAPLKAALLDQRLIAGLGNIYVCEALWRARLRPDRAAGTLVKARGRPKPSAERLTYAIRGVLTDAIAAGGSSLRDYVNVSGDMGGFQNDFDVYDREGEPCRRPSCRGIVRRIVQSGRSTFYCGVCQR